MTSPSPFRTGSSRSDVPHRGRAEPWHRRIARLYTRAPDGPRGEGARFALFALLLALAALLGGSSRTDAVQLLPLRPAAILLGSAMLLLPAARGTVSRAPAWLFAALAAAIALQLVPLPPALWGALPGHARFREAAAALGLAQPWRPISVAPDLTLGALLALGVPGAVLLGGAALRPDQRAAAAGLALALGGLSALLGLAQVSGAGVYLYAPTEIGRPVGLFANVNHQAAVLAALLPVAAAWAVAPRRRGPMRALLAGAAGVLMLACVLVSGSRAGLLLAFAGVLTVPLVIGNRVALSPRLRRLVPAAVLAGAALLVLATWAAGRLGGLDRLLGAGADQRVTYLPVTLGLLRAYAPFGSGFGTFDAVFRIAEPDAILKPTYFNHAHNDLLELGITGGVAALAVLLAFLLWAAGAARRAFAGAGSAAPLARAGACAGALLLLASLADYPLRTPLAGVLLALAVLWLAERGAGAGADATPPE